MVCERLRQAREAAGLSLDDLAARTKIRPPILAAIERGDVNRLPGTFYTRAFLQAYAREVALDPDEIVREYLGDEPEPSPTTARPEAAHVAPEPIASGAPAGARFWPVALVAVAGIALLSMVNNRAGAPSEPAAVGTAGLAAPPAAMAPIQTTADKLTLEIRPAGVVWVEVRVDGQQVLYRLLQPGERHTFEARDDLAIVIGDASALEYSINGEPGRTLGGPAEKRIIHVTRDNYREFVQTRVAT
jgi:cytoskeletal protein RodZ